MKKVLSIFVVVSLLVLYTGCATLFTGGKGKVMATSDPEGAEVLVNGQSMGKTPVQLKLKTKEAYEVTFKKDGYKTVTKKLENKIGVTWLILDIIGGLLPVIVDAATGNWMVFDTKTLNVRLDK